MPVVFLECHEMVLRHLRGAMDLDGHPALGPTHLDRLASDPIRHRENASHDDPSISWLAVVVICSDPKVQL